MSDDAAAQAALAIHDKASLGVAYQKAIAAMRPAEVYDRIHAIHINIQAIEESVISRTAVMALENVEHGFRDFYSGRDRGKS